jgi:hypothetical protein
MSMAPLWCFPEEDERRLVVVVVVVNGAKAEAETLFWS